jgi:hypothetical protein
VSQQFNPGPVSADTALKLQRRGTDVKTAVEAQAKNMWLELLLQGVHPWVASDKEFVRRACRASAAVMDCVADAMLDAALSTDRRGRQSLPYEVNLFVCALSENAPQQYHGADALFESIEAWEQDDPDNPQVYEFDEEVRNNFYIGNHFPNFPEVPGEHGQRRPPGRSSDAGYVTPAFVQAMIAAAAYLRVAVDDLIKELDKYRPDTPWQYATLREDIRTTYRNRSEDLGKQAQDWLERLDETQLNFDFLGQAYQAAYDALICAAFVYTVLYCPPLFGKQWFLDRT